MFQANLGNVREFKLAVKKLKAERRADFRVALTEAFKAFNKVRECLCKSKKQITLCSGRMQLLISLSFWDMVSHH
jgi:hypothetical protein